MHHLRQVRGVQGRISTITIRVQEHVIQTSCSIRDEKSQNLAYIRQYMFSLQRTILHRPNKETGCYRIDKEEAPGRCY